MQEDAQILHNTISKIITNVRTDKGISYTDFCLGNEIPSSTYDAIIKANNKTYFYNIAKVVKALGLSFEEFGKMLDEELPENFMNNED
jgi:predicted transcriptional regulator